MRFISKSVLVVLAQAFLVLGQNGPNAFAPVSGATAGQSLTLNWTPTTSGTVSLILRSGPSNNLNAGTYVAQNIPNSGSYVWSIPSDVTRGSDYTVEIVSDTDSSVTNFAPYFVIESTNTVASSTNQISRGTSATATPSGSATATSTGSAVSSAVSSANSLVSSASASINSVVSSLSSAASSSGSAMSSSMSTASRSSSAGASSSAASAASAASSSSITVPSTGSAAMATAFPGLMGALALGALVL